MDSIKILIAGDFAPVGRLNKLFKTMSPDHIFNGIVDYVKGADYSLVNLEAPIGDNNIDKIKKSGPHLSASRESILALKQIGFDACTLANNHFRDYGDNGINNTITYLETIGIEHVGAGQNIENARKILYKKIKEKVVAFIAVCEKEFSIATDEHCGSASADTISVVESIMEAKKNADFSIVIIHGGHEHFHYPSPRMKRLYRFFIDMGATAVVNHHQHCVCGYEIYKNSPIIYGLGNFCFDSNKHRNSSWNEGYLAIINIGSNIRVDIIPYTQCNETPSVHIMQGNEATQFHMRIQSYNDIIQDDKQLNAKYQEFIQVNKRKNIISVFSPYLTDYFRIAAGHHFIPYLLPKAKVRAIINMIECEAHYDETISVLKKYIE